MKRALLNVIFPIIDPIYKWIDRRLIRRTRNIRLIPDFKNRKGGKVSYAEWAHVIGIFQTLIYQNLDAPSGNDLLDIGCGTGLLGISAEPSTSEGGSYTGIDIMKHDIEYCRKHYQANNYNFIHFDVQNPSYAESQDVDLKPWPIADESKDLVTALSVWTHLREEHAIYYFHEIGRVLKNGGRAIITFFYLDEGYQKSLGLREKGVGRFHRTKQADWIFDRKAYGSNHWYSPDWVQHPEDAIGLTVEGLESMINDSNLELIQYYPGNWKERPGVFFQDVLIFQRRT